MTKHIAVLGAGSWGTALATHLASCHHSVTLWGRDEKLMQTIADTGENAHYLPGVPLAETLRFENKLHLAVKNVEGIVIATPCTSFISLLDALEFHLKKDMRLVWACKGMTNNQLLHDVVAAKLGNKCPVAVVSGPSFAGELARGLPTAVTVASPESTIAGEVSQWFHSDTFRAYQSEDIIGVQIAGALKNVFAIAAGISDGLGFGANARSALITRGLAELMRLGAAMGAKRDTLMGLSGVGDLILTCTDDQSRNRQFGLALGSGESRHSAVSRIGQIVEGVNTSREARELASRHSIEMPIADEVYQVVHQNKPANAAVADLLARTQKVENE